VISKDFIGLQFPEVEASLSRPQLKFFAKATGQTNPIYFDQTAALKAGYPDIVAPPTWPALLDGLTYEGKLPVIEAMQLVLENVLHGEQAFEYFGPLFAEEKIKIHGEIIDIYEKKAGALEFVVQRNSYLRESGEVILNSRYTFVYVNK
jgi:hypothetical protein